ncbi:PIN domain-containing protein [Candidatus Woesearchaeota archaeon]|nr:PIN domain-containing protein [Candidatus Woesearchaeota archaeon]
MPKKYYIDTCIWRDLHENREDKFRPLGEWAFEFFRKIRKNKDVVLYSRLVTKELLKEFNKKTINEIFSIVKEEGLLEEVKINEKQSKEALKLKNKLIVPFEDALHAVLAKENKAVLVTRDKHFIQFQNILEIKKPEELI